MDVDVLATGISNAHNGLGMASLTTINLDAILCRQLFKPNFPSDCATSETLTGAALTVTMAFTYCQRDLTWLEMSWWRPSQNTITINYLRLTTIRMYIRLQTVYCLVQKCKNFLPMTQCKNFWAVCRLLYSEGCNYSKWIMPKHQLWKPVWRDWCDIFSRVTKSSNKWRNIKNNSFTSIKIMRSGPYSHLAFEALFVWNVTCHHIYR